MTDVNTQDQAVFMPHSLGPYNIESELGSGAMGTVFRALHTGLDREVALKVLRPDMLQDPDSIRRFLREARSIARLEHPHIVAVYDAGEAEGVHYIAMKLLAGETLQSILVREGALPYHRVIHIATQLASALDYAHSHDVVHLDVKPANVIVAGGDYTTLTDFSIAKALNPGATRSATIAGTPLYMSPEQIQGDDVDSRSDLYSLGLLIYEMCVGRPPFQGQFVTVMYAHLHTPIPDPRTSLPDLPAGLEALIYRALAKDRSERFQTGSEMLRALERCQAGHEDDAAAPTVVLGDRQPALDAPGGPAGLAATGAAPAAAERIPAPREAVARPAGRKRAGWTIAGATMATIVVAAVVAFFVTRGSTASAGSVTIASVPAGATISLDGSPRGRTPLTLNNIPKGSHSVSFALNAHDGQTLPVTVIGGKTTRVQAILRPWPARRLVTVDQGMLVRGYTRDPATGRVTVNSVVSSLTATQLHGTRIYVVAHFQSRQPVHAPGEHLGVQIVLTDSDGIRRAVFPARPMALTLPAGIAPSITFPTGQFRAPLGRWRVDVLVNGESLKTLTFAVTH